MTPTSFRWIHGQYSLTYYLSEKAGLNFINYFFLRRSFFVLFLFLTIGCSVPPLRWHSKIRKYLSMDLKAYQKEYRNVAKTSCTWIIYRLCTRRSEKKRHSLSFFEPFHLPKNKSQLQERFSKFPSQDWAVMNNFVSVWTFKTWEALLHVNLRSFRNQVSENEAGKDFLPWNNYAFTCRSNSGNYHRTGRYDFRT